MQIIDVMEFVDIFLRFLAPLLGVLFGIPFAFWIDRKTKERSKRERAIAVLSALKEEINHNVGLLKQIQNELKPNSMIYYNVDMNTWRATSLEEFEGIVSHKLLRHIYRIYYEYEHMSRKIDTQFTMHYSVVRAMGKTYMKEREHIVGAILTHAKPLHDESKQLIEEMETELKRLSKSQPKDKKEGQRMREKAFLFWGVVMGVILGIFGNLFTNWFYDVYRESWWMPIVAPSSFGLVLIYLMVMTFVMTRWLRQAQ